MIVLASVAADGVAITAIDPHMGPIVGRRKSRPTRPGDDDYDLFHANLSAAGVDERVTHVAR